MRRRAVFAVERISSGGTITAWSVLCRNRKCINYLHGVWKPTREESAREWNRRAGCAEGNGGEEVNDEAFIEFLRKVAEIKLYEPILDEQGRAYAERLVPERLYKIVDAAKDALKKIEEAKE